MPDEYRPTEWFEPLYRDAGESGAGPSWAHMETQPSFKAWLDQKDLKGGDRSALVVGCGMGDDAIELSSRGFKVTAFDVSKSAIAHCNRRFPDSDVTFLQGDLFAENAGWAGRFDFVLEIYTIQALPPRYEDEVIGRIADYVAEDGQLLVVAIVGSEERSFESGPPWALTPDHIQTFQRRGLTVVDRIIREKASKKGDDVWITAFQRSTENE